MTTYAYLVQSDITVDIGTNFLYMPEYKKWEVMMQINAFFLLSDALLSLIGDKCRKRKIHINSSCAEYMLGNI